MQTHTDIATLKQQVAEKREVHNKHRERANRLAYYDTLHYGEGRWRTETWHAIDIADKSEADLHAAEREVAQAKQQLQTQQQKPPAETQPDTTTETEQTEDQTREETQQNQTPQEPNTTTANKIVDALTQKFTGNKIVDALIQKNGDTDE